MQLTEKAQRNSSLEIYRLIIDKCYRMNLLPASFDLIELSKTLNLQPSTLNQELDNHLATALLPAINKLLQKGLFDLYHILYSIDVSEEAIKEKIMSVENTAIIPSVIAFAIIDRLKEKYERYPFLPHNGTDATNRS